MDSSSRVHVTATAQRTVAAPGQDIAIAVVFDHDEHWHIHTNDPQVPPQLGEASDYIKTQITAPPDQQIPHTFTAHTGFIQWPKPVTVKVDFTGESVDYAVFAGKAVAYVPVTINPDTPLGKTALTLNVTYQSCDEHTCLAPVFDQPVTVTLDIVDPATLANQTPPTVDTDETFRGFDAGVWAKIHSGSTPPGEKSVAFDLFGLRFHIDADTGVGLIALWLVAAVGGFLLNFTPCVLPVIPIKVLSLQQAAHGKVLPLGISMSLGVVAFWLAVGAAIASVSGFDAVNKLFQYPVFTIGVGAFIAAMAVGMCGLFAFRLPTAVYNVTPKQDTLLGSFGFGVMTAVLSTPCTAPFMGAAIGWATQKPPTVSLPTFAFIGLGMALPYFILTINTKLIDKLPRTGPGSELLKQIMGLFMLAAAAYFVGIGVIGLIPRPPEQPPSSLYWWVVFGFTAVAGLWLAWKTLRITRKPVWRSVFVSLGVIVVLSSIVLGQRLTDKGPIDWVYYTPQRFTDAKAKGSVVVMDFTAEWCLNCKTLEQSVLHDPRVVALFKLPGAGGVTPIKVDITSKDNTAGNNMLRSVDRLTIPLLVIFAPDGREVFKGDFYTVEQVVAAVEKARQK